jgi:hypothetical protein
LIKPGQRLSPNGSLWQRRREKLHFKVESINDKMENGKWKMTDGKWVFKADGA